MTCACDMAHAALHVNSWRSRTRRMRRARIVGAFFQLRVGGLAQPLLLQRQMRHRLRQLRPRAREVTRPRKLICKLELQFELLNAMFQQGFWKNNSL